MSATNPETGAEEQEGKDSNEVLKQDTPVEDGERTSDVQLQPAEEVVQLTNSQEEGVPPEAGKKEEPTKEEETENATEPEKAEVAVVPVKEEVPTTNGGEVPVGGTDSTNESTMPPLTENAAGTGPTVLVLAAEQKENELVEKSKGEQPAEENGDSKPAAETKPPAVAVVDAAEKNEGQSVGLPSTRTIATDPKDITAETLVILKTGPDGQTVAVVPPLEPPKHVKKGEVLKRPQNTTTVVTRNGKTWNEMFEALVAYKEEHGDCYVPDRYKNEDGVCLGLWVRNQRRREESLTADQHKRLSDLGLDWQTQNERFDNVWHERYAKLTSYRVEHGDCKVPYTYKADPALAKWVSQQRAQQAQGRLAPDRKAKLDAIDFSWKLNTVKNRNTKTEDKKWMRQYEKLVAFHEENGHCKVPDRYKPDRPLGTWVKKQRLANACNQLKEDRKKMLDDLGFVWRITDKTDAEKWDKMFTQLKEYKESNGTCHVSRTVPDGDLKPLARWVKTQRALYKSGKILPERKAKLEELDFVWDGTQLPIKRKRRRSTDEVERMDLAAEMPPIPAKKAKMDEPDGDKKPAAVDDGKAPEKKAVVAKRVLPTSSQKAEATSHGKSETDGRKGDDDDQAKAENGSKPEDTTTPMDTSEDKEGSNADAVADTKDSSGDKNADSVETKETHTGEKEDATKQVSSVGRGITVDAVSPLRRSRRSADQAKAAPSKADGDSTEEEDEEGDSREANNIVFI